MTNMRTMQLPVSGLSVRFRAPDGGDDLVIVEATGTAVERALAVLPRLVEVVELGDRTNSGSVSAFWGTLTVTDCETVLLGLRRFLFGDKVSCVFRDNTHACAERMELEFSITAFLEDARPRAHRGVEQVPENPGWFRLAADGDAGLRFRLPVIEDQLAAMSEADGAEVLTRRCIEVAKLNARTISRVERVMEAMAPAVSRPLVGKCPGCGEPVTVSLHVARLVMEELQSLSAGIHEQIDAIAAAYHWGEADILALPQRRRRAYAGMIQQRQRAAV